MHEADAQQVQAFVDPFGRLSTGSGRDRSHRRLGQQWRRDPPLSAATDMPVILRDAGLTLRSGVFHAIVSLRAASCGDPRHCIDRKSVVSGKSVSVRVYFGGGRILKKKKK